MEPEKSLTIRSRMSRVRPGTMKIPGFVLHAILALTAFTGPLCFATRSATSQVSTEDKHFPVTVDPAKLPKGALMRIGQIGERTTYMGVYDIRFSPNGQLVALKGRDHVVRLFDLHSGQKVCEVDGHENRVRGVEFAPDSKTFATLGFGENDCVVLWETQTGKEIKRFPYGGDDMIFSSDGKFIHVMREKRLDRIEVADGKVTKLMSWPQSEKSIGLSRDGTTVATALQQQTRAHPIYLNTYDNGRVSRFGISAMRAMTTQVEFSQNRNWFLARFDHQRQIYHWYGDRPKQKTELGIHETEVYSLSSSHDNRYFLSTAKDGGAFLWDAISKTNVYKIEGHDESSNIVACEFSPDGTLFATGASGRKDSSMIIWDLKKVVFPRIGETADPVNDEALERIWNQLSDNVSKTAHSAIEDFVVHGDQVAKHFHDRVMKSTNIVDQSRIGVYISQLNDRKYSVRAKATDSLLKLRNVAEAKLREALRQTQSVEVRYRIDKILKTSIKKPKIDPPEYRRLQRIIHALELTANETSIKLLDSLAKGHPHIDISREALSALKRVNDLKTRPKQLEQ